MLSKWLTIGFVALILAFATVQSANIQDYRQPGNPRVFFPLEVNVPDVINGFLSAFRFLWGRLQSIVGYSGSSQIIGAKDPPKPLPAPLTPSPALQAVPLAPEEVLKSPVQLVSVEVDDPVRHPSVYHKTKIRRTKQKPKKKKKGKIAPSLVSEWELLAMEEGWI
ncbi:AAEL004598-PA [Aedes aegypti]|uniref:AAEL004598-PA n=1 Tax=Aedes aegypti TaxID=7159 RepID=Q17CD8_AEDAE|nr:AAEL004598-PA [Aedes aegypti]